MSKSVIRVSAAGLFIAGVSLTLSVPSLNKTSDLEQTLVGIAQAPSEPMTYEEVRSLVSEAVDQALGSGGFANLVTPADQVFIKINANYGSVPGSNPLGYLTDPRVVRAVAELLTGIVPSSQIKVGEGISHVGTTNLVEFQDGGYDLDLDGYLDGVSGVELVCLNEPHDPASGTDPAYVTYFTGAPGHQSTTWYIPNVIAQADVRISIPVLKTHDIAGLTAAMKNSIGHLPCDIYYAGSYIRTYEVRAAVHQAYPVGPAAAIADINAVVPYHFVVADALTAHRYGPWSVAPDRIYPYAIVAGRDAVAVDTALSAVIGWDSTVIDYLVYGQNDGTGVADSAYISVRGVSVQDLRTDLATRFPGKIPFPLGYGNGINGTSGSEAADTNSPWVSVTAPSPGAPVSGTVTVQFNSGDNDGVAKAELLVNGVPAGHIPYPGSSDSFLWDSGSVPPGTHTLSVYVYDGAFNEAADGVSVLVGTGAAYWEVY